MQNQIEKNLQHNQSRTVEINITPALTYEPNSFTVSQLV